MIKDNANRVIINTIILYLKIIITSLISLISVPIILNALGSSDYGLYNLIGGVVALLAFLKASMAVSTQRFLSVAIGKNNIEDINYIYNTSLILHFIIGLFLVLLLESLSPFLFNGFLNIDYNRVGAAKVIYQFLIFTLFLEVSSVPFTGVLNAKENMLVFSLLGIFESACKLILALFLPYYVGDKLILYGVGMMLIALIIFLFNVFFVLFYYKEFKINFTLYYNKDKFKQISGFTGWNTFGALAVVGRNQGISVVLNLFFGTVINAAYGVANQINGVLGYFSQTFQKSINPQLMKSYGMGDSDRLKQLVFVSSKFSVLGLALLGVPFIIEMRNVLYLWLKNPPEYTLELSQLIIIYSIIKQFSVGLMNGISSTGKIRNYQIIMSIIILLNIPFAYLLLHFGKPPYFSILVFIFIEIISLMIRIKMSSNIIGINSYLFLKEVIFPTIFCMVISGTLVLIPHFLLEETILRFFVVVILYVFLFIFFVWVFVLDSYEKLILTKFFNKVYKR